VHLTTADAERVADPELAGVTVDAEGGDAGQAVDRLLEPVVAVRGRHLGVGTDLALEHRCRAMGVVGLDEKADLDVAQADRGACAHGALLVSGKGT
jgi:hypothetical protein